MEETKFDTPLKTTETTETETLGLFMSLSPRLVIGLLSATYAILQAFVSNKPSKYDATLFIIFSSYRPQTTCLKHSFLLQILPLRSTCALLSPSFRSSFLRNLPTNEAFAASHPTVFNRLLAQAHENNRKAPRI